MHGSDRQTDGVGDDAHAHRHDGEHAHRCGGAADDGAPLQHENPAAGLCQVARGHQPVVSRSDDDCVVGAQGFIPDSKWMRANAEPCRPGRLR